MRKASVLTDESRGQNMNKMLKKITSVALAIAMVVTTVYVGNPTTAQAKVTIKSKKTVTLIAETAAKLKLNKKVLSLHQAIRKLLQFQKKEKSRLKSLVLAKLQ